MSGLWRLVAAFAAVTAPKELGTKYAVEIVSGWVQQRNPLLCSNNAQGIARAQCAEMAAIAADEKSGKVWLINDPDSVRGNYRALADDEAEGPFAAYTPLLFEVPVAQVLPGWKPVDPPPSE